MSRKVLVADDSLTIQKVVSITLANNGFDLVECMNEKDLFSRVGSDQFDLILLDFNLSEDKSGYQIAEEIVKHAPSTPIMVMLGTFDTVDDSALEQSGIRDKIIKPFESSKFIKKCQELIEQSGFAAPVGGHDSSSSDEFSMDEQDESSFTESNENFMSEGSQESPLDVDDEIGDQWTVDNPAAMDENTDPMPEGNFLETENSERPQSQNALLAEIEGWGMSVPGVIGKSAGVSLPPRIGGDHQPQSFEIEQEFNSVDVQSNDKVPNSDDLEYPDMNDLSFGDDNDSDFPSLVPLDELNFDESDSGDSFVSLKETPQEDNNLLENEIESELDPNEFWATDSDSISGDLEESVSAPTYNEPTPEPSEPIVSIDLNSLEEETPAPYVAPASVSVNEDEIVERIKVALGPMIEEMVKDYCSQKVEQVAWEIIPDLAENLIRNEIKEIAQSVRD